MRCSCFVLFINVLQLLRNNNNDVSEMEEDGECVRAAGVRDPPGMQVLIAALQNMNEKNTARITFVTTLHTWQLYPEAETKREAQHARVSDRFRLAVTISRMESTLFGFVCLAPFALAPLLTRAFPPCCLLSPSFSHSISLSNSK